MEGKQPVCPHLVSCSLCIVASLVNHRRETQASEGSFLNCEERERGASVADWRAFRTSVFGRIGCSLADDGIDQTDCVKVTHSYNGTRRVVVVRPLVRIDKRQSRSPGRTSSTLVSAPRPPTAHARYRASTGVAY
jgi:hypothetical protein